MMTRNEIENSLKLFHNIELDSSILDSMLKTSKIMEGELVSKAFPYVLAAGFTALLERLEKG